MLPGPGGVEIVRMSLRLGVALLFATLVESHRALGLTRFAGKRLVVAPARGWAFRRWWWGLFVYLLLSRSGPLGQLNAPWVPALFTPGAMVLAQSIISFPLVAGFTMAAVMGVEPQLRQQVQALGATRLQTAATILSEARIGVVVSVIAGFGSIISEVGAVMLVGGNIEGRTRVHQRHHARTRKGRLTALAWGPSCWASFAANLAMLQLQGRALHE